MNPHESASRSQRRKPTTAQFLSLTLFLSVCVVGIVSSAARSTQEDMNASTNQERVFKDLTSDRLPIKMKLKKEKEQAVRDIRNKNWSRDLEIEVKNTGSKPIYYIVMNIVMRDVLIQGHPLAFQMRYGRPELVYLTTPIQPDDVPILPGESVSVKIPEKQVKAYEKSRDQERRDDPKRIELDLQFINFGDGTGLAGPDGKLIPDPARKSSQNVPSSAVQNSA